jgi:membrane fusion protein (multidrug efflux system)
MKNKKWLWLGLAILLLIFAWRVVGRLTAAEEKEAERIVPVFLARPTVGKIAEKLMLTGDVKGASEVLVKPALPGRVMEIFVQEGDQVEAGTPLLSYKEGLRPGDELYDDLTVFAPIAGLVGVKYVNLGDQTSVSNPVFSLYDIDTVKIYANLPEKYYSQAKPGIPVTVVLDAFPGKRFPARLSTIRPVVDPLSRTTQIEISINNPGRQIKPGMFGRVELVLREKNKALLLPFDAILGDGEKYVYVTGSDVARKKTVKLGLVSGQTAEVIGLSASDQVIVVGQRVVKEGDRIGVAR